MLEDGRTLGIALSGGGYRATLFGLGSLWRLNEMGLLGKLDRITSVSGGSILNGVLAHHWSALDFDGDGSAGNFEAEVAAPVRAICSRTIDIGSVLWGALSPFRSAGEFLADSYRRQLFGDATLKDLPAPVPGRTPVFLFYATNMQTGRSFRMRQDYVADWMIGRSMKTVVSLADAVAASSAFPPVFSPVVLKTDPSHWQDADPGLKDLAALRSRIVLADGGVYDNMGLEALVDNVDISLVSDAGAPFAVDVTPPEDTAFQLGRVRDILIDQTRSLRKRWLVSDYIAGRKRGSYWGIGTNIAEYGVSDALPCASEQTTALEAVPTRLGGFSQELQDRLVNWGYALADAALRGRVAIGKGPAPSWPRAPGLSFPCRSG